MEKKSSGAQTARTDHAYTVRANPVLHEDGDQAGKLDYVRFTADSPNGTHKEWHVKAAQLDNKLHLLESSGMRYQILSKLQSGARADLPGTYTPTQLAELGLR
jgi:hypothetical protein